MPAIRLQDWVSVPGFLLSNPWSCVSCNPCCVQQNNPPCCAQVKGSPVSVHLASPGMVATDLLMRAVTNERSRTFINILAEDAQVVSAWLVPRMRGVKGNGTYFK